MNDLETRLGDALDAAARTVPDTATGPGLQLAPAPRPVRRIVVVAVAAAAVVAAVVIPLAVRNTTDRGTNPVGTDCSNPTPVEPALPTSDGTASYDGEQWADSLPAGPPPRVPYVVRSPGADSYLQDGRRRITWPAGKQLELIAQVGCEWLVLDGTDDSARAVSVLHADGSLTRRGEAARAAAVSPDRTAIAFVAWGTNRITVVALDSGRVVDRLEDVPAGSAAYVWSDDGIWYSDDNYHEYAHVWQPGSAPRKLTHDADEFLPVPGTDLVVLGETQNGTCIDLLRLTPAATETVMRHCGENESTGLVSPDGKILITTAGTAYRIPQNTRTGTVQIFPPSFTPIAWEDGTHVLVQATTGTADRTGRETVLRCDALSGSCERIYDAQRGTDLVIPYLR